MSKLLTIWNYIRRHKYMITVLIFIVVIGFLDENSLIQPSVASIMMRQTSERSMAMVARRTL